MTYELTLCIQEDSPQGLNIDTMAETEHLSREEAALKLLAGAATGRTPGANADARRIIGAFKQDATLMDEVLDLAMQDRERRNSAPPHA